MISREPLNTDRHKHKTKTMITTHRLRIDEAEALLAKHFSELIPDTLTSVSIKRPVLKIKDANKIELVKTIRGLYKLFALMEREGEIAVIEATSGKLNLLTCKKVAEYIQDGHFNMDELIAAKYYDDLINKPL